MHPNTERRMLQDSFDAISTHLHDKSESCDSEARRTCKKNRSVHFDQSVKVATIPHMNDFTEEEVSLVWYTPEEYEQTRSSCMKIVRRMNKKANDSHSKPDSTSSPSLKSAMCTRGLEGLSKVRGTTRRIRRLAAADAVLTEQSFQIEDGHSDPDFLSRLYQQISAPCQQEAHMVGLQDEKEAMQCYELQENLLRAACLVTNAKSSRRLATKNSSPIGRIARTRS